MSLPTCPSCGQSVLEDNVVDCPFCGAAMDGSRGAKSTPRPKANPVASRPGARKLPEKPAASSSPTSATPADPPKAPPKPPAGRAGKPVVDEDDPFGIGSAATAAQAIQAVLKPEKGRMHRVICPMCEQQGFVPKTAVGKLVKCANEKCMVPLFTAPDPNAPVERKPTRLSDDAEAARRAAESSQPRKKNPIMIYMIVGGVLLGLTMVLVPLLTKQDVDPKLTTPVEIKDFGLTDEEQEQLDREKAAKAKAAADAADPRIEVAATVRRMIGLARQSGLRDKAWARRMTGDLFQRIGDTASAGTEFNQLVVVDRTRGFYRIDSHLTRYWKAIGSADAAGARQTLEDAIKEVPSIPRSGRIGTEACLGLAAALVNDGRRDYAVQLVASRQLDRTIPDNQDLLASTAWSFLSSRCREASLTAPPATDQLSWMDPLHAAVAGELAVQQRWTESLAWASAGSGARAVSDALLVITDIAGQLKPDASVFTQIEGAVPGDDPIGKIRILGALAAAEKSAARADACLAALSGLPAIEAAAMPKSGQLVQDDIKDQSGILYQMIAAAEAVRGAVAAKPDQAAATLARVWSISAGVAPPTFQLRAPMVQLLTNEAGFRKQLAQELLMADDSEFASTFRTYRRHLEQLLRQAEDRRLTLLLVLSRIVRSGGANAVQEALKVNPELTAELQLDVLGGFLNASAIMIGKSALISSDTPGRPLQGAAENLGPIAGILNLAWAQKDQNLANCLVGLETQAGKSLPGFRQNLVFEFVDLNAKSVPAAADLLTAISRLQNGAWREEAYMIAGRGFADRKLEKQADAWTATTKVPALEHASLLYGISLGLLERPVPGSASEVTP